MPKRPAYRVNVRQEDRTRSMLEPGVYIGHTINYGVLWYLQIMDVVFYHNLREVRTKVKRKNVWISMQHQKISM